MNFYTDFSEYYDTIFPFRPKVLEFLNRWLPEKGHVLDVGCGTGIYCNHLRQAGRSFLGTDLDEDMIKEARKRHPRGNYQVLGMGDLDTLASGSFSAIFCIGNVLPHLPAGQLMSFLKTIKTLLVPGGTWLFQTVNFDPILNQTEYQFPVLSFPEKELQFHRRYSGITPEALLFQTRLQQGSQDLFQGEVTLCPRTSDHLLQSHQQLGFHLKGHFADFSEKPFDGDSNSGNIMVFTSGA